MCMRVRRTLHPQRVPAERAAGTLHYGTVLEVCCLQSSVRCLPTGQVVHSVRCIRPLANAPLFSFFSYTFYQIRLCESDYLKIGLPILISFFFAKRKKRCAAAGILQKALRAFYIPAVLATSVASTLPYAAAGIRTRVSSLEG